MSLPAEQSNGAEGPSGGPKTAEGKEEKDVLGLSTQEHWHERMNTAGLANDPATFRAALKGWERAEDPPAPPKALATENEAKVKRFLTQGVSIDSRGCHAW